MQNAEKIPDELVADLKETLAYAEELQRNGTAMMDEATKAQESAKNTILMGIGVAEEAKRRAIKKLGLLPADSLDLKTFTFVKAPPTESAEHEQPPTP